MSTIVWIMLAALYLALLVALGLTTLRRGHTVLFIVGIFLPFLWLVGAVMPPTDHAAAVESGTDIRP